VYQRVKKKKGPCGQGVLIAESIFFTIAPVEWQVDFKKKRPGAEHSAPGLS